MHIIKYKQLVLTSITLVTLSLVFTGAALADDDERSPRQNKMPKSEQMKQKEAKLATREAEIKTRMASKSADLNRKMDKLTSRTAEMASRSAQRWEDRCKNINERVSQRIARYEQNKSKHFANYEQMKKRLAEVTAKLDSQSVDTTKLKTDMTQLDALIKKASDDYAAFIASLKTSQGITCGKSEGAFADALKTSRDKLQAARKSMEAIREYYKNTIRPDIMAIKKQMASMRPNRSGSPRPTVSSVASATPAASAQ